MIALVAAASAAPIGFQRVDLLSEDPGTWLAHEAPRAGVSGRVVAARWLFQVKPVWRLPVDGLVLGTSLESQSLVYERPLGSLPLEVHGGVQMQAFLPRGLVMGVGGWAGPVRIAAGASFVSAATWSRPDYRYWSVLPGIGLGVGRPPFPARARKGT